MGSSWYPIELQVLSPHLPALPNCSCVTQVTEFVRT